MQTCMGPLTSRGWTLNDVTNKGSRTVYRYHRNAINRPRHNDRLTTRIAHRTRSSHFRPDTLGVRTCSKKKRGESVELYRTQGVFNRFNWYVSKFKISELHIIFWPQKLCGQFGFRPKFHAFLHTVLKSWSDNQNAKIFQIQCCVLKGVRSITVKYIFSLI